MPFMSAQDQTFVAIGFLGGLFLMKTFRVLRPASAEAMSGLSNVSTCSSCRGR